MADMRMGAVEARFAQLIWEHEPLTSGELVRLCQQELSWKKSTTYTILRRLCERGIFQNNQGVVTSRLSQEEFQAMQSEQFLEEAFDGSLPRFLTAFSRRNKLSPQEIQQLQELIDKMR